MERKTAMFCGSFDPLTLGHIDIINKALTKYEKLIINVGVNEQKKTLFASSKRLALINNVLKYHPEHNRIITIAEKGMTVDVALLYDVDVLIRGMRHNSTNMDEEQKLAKINKLLALSRGLELETELLEQEDSFFNIISSSQVKTLCQLGEFITAFRFVPDVVAEALAKFYLKPVWDNLFIKDCSYVDSLWQDFIKCYQGRAYHNLTHIAYMLNMLKIYMAYSGDKLGETYKDIVFAIFAHDLVYDLRADNGANEEQSALFVEGIIPWLVRDINPEAVKELILSTSHKDRESTSLVRDLDLSILATDDEQTWQLYNEKIRREYIEISDSEYIPKRLEFLQSLANKQIFGTSFFFNKFEDKAKRNLQSEIQRLQNI